MWARDKGIFTYILPKAALASTSMLKRLRQRVQQYRESLAFRYMPRIAEWSVWAASAKAMPKLREMGPVKLLLDSTIHAHAITHEDAWVDTGTKLWGEVHPVRTGYSARIPVHSADNDTPLYRDICRLTVITTLARKGVFELYTSAELMAERDRHPPARFRTTGYSDFSLLDGLAIESVDGWNFDSLTMRRATISNLQEAQRARLRSSGDPLYEGIVRALGSETHSQDAWHIRTAQSHGMYALLTMDYSLVRLVGAQRKKLAQVGLTTRILTPSMLGVELGFGAVPPYLFSYTDASFPVRSDLCWPDERRRPTRAKRKK
jgi:hypothetical protein